MKDEVYDVLDEHGKPVDHATWTEVHSKGLLHQTAVVFVFKDETRNELLVHKRSAKMKHAPNTLYGSAGGHVLAGDTPEQGAQKELHEELFHGHHVPALLLRHVATYRLHDFPGNYEITHLYETVHPGPFFPYTEEIEGKPYWVPWDELVTHMHSHPEEFSGAFREAVKHYVK